MPQGGKKCSTVWHFYGSDTIELLLQANDDFVTRD